MEKEKIEEEFAKELEALIVFLEEDLLTGSEKFIETLKDLNAEIARKKIRKHLQVKVNEMFFMQFEED
jgi:hypothetical protein